MAGWAPEDTVLRCSQNGQPISQVPAGAWGSVGLVGSVKPRGTALSAGLCASLAAASHAQLHLPRVPTSQPGSAPAGTLLAAVVAAGAPEHYWVRKANPRGVLQRWR